MVRNCTKNVLILVFGTVVARRNNETFSLSCASVNSFNNVNEFLFIIHCPIDLKVIILKNNLVIITCSQVNHDVSVSVEKHECTWIIYFIH